MRNTVIANVNAHTMKAQTVAVRTLRVSLESEGEVCNNTASCSGLQVTASHFWRLGFFFFLLKKQQHFVSDTTSTSVGMAMGVLECPVVGLSGANSLYVELTTWTESWRSLGARLLPRTFISGGFE